MSSNNCGQDRTSTSDPCNRVAEHFNLEIEIFPIFVGLELYIEMVLPCLLRNTHNKVILEGGPLFLRPHCYVHAPICYFHASFC